MSNVAYYCAEAKQFVLPMNLLAILLLSASYRVLRRLYKPESPRHSAFLRKGSIAWATNSLYVCAEIVASHPLFAKIIDQHDRELLLSIALLFSTLSSAYLLYAGLEYIQPRWRTHRLAYLATGAYIAFAFAPLISHVLQWYYDRMALGVVIANCISICIFAAAFRRLLDSHTNSRRLELLVQGPLVLYGILQLAYGARFLGLGETFLAVLDAAGFALGTTLKIAHLAGISLITVSRARLLQSLEQDEATRQYERRAISEMVHELTTPAAALKLQLDQMQAAVIHRGNVKEETRRTVDLITILLAIVHGAFDLVRLTSDAGSEEKYEVANANELLQAAVMSVKLSMAGKRPDGFMSFVTQYAQQPEILCVRTRMKQIFINLIKNAYDAASPDGGTISITTVKRVDTSHRLKSICITIADDGEGISPRNAKRVFEHGYSTRMGEGRGHGLAIVQQIVSDHSGTVSLRSPLRSGRGTAFDICLPAAALAAPHVLQINDNLDGPTL